MHLLPGDLHLCHIHLIGGKGSGMLPLAELLQTRGALLTASDVKEIFPTDGVLKSLNIRCTTGFAAEHIPENTQYVIYSHAWNSPDNPEIREAKRRNLPLLSYNEALGSISKQHFCVAVSGTHGKSSCSAIIASLLNSLHAPATVLCGAGMLNFAGHGVFSRGSDILVVEACEYRESFLSLFPDIVLINNIEWEHPDYFRDEEAVLQSFLKLAMLLPEHSQLIYSADSPGSIKLTDRLRSDRPDLQLCSYGYAAKSDYRITELQELPGKSYFQVNGDPLCITQPGRHLVSNVCAAIAVVENSASKINTVNPDREKIANGVMQYKGLKRRSEILGYVNGITFIDDYAHHPTAITETLASYKNFFRAKRLIVDFMPHTYSRTKQLLDAFMYCFESADCVILQDIYASARELPDAAITGALFAEMMQKHHPSVRYEPDFEHAASYISGILKTGDAFVTMGAGSNWQIMTPVMEQIRKRDTECTE